MIVHFIFIACIDNDIKYKIFSCFISNLYGSITIFISLNDAFLVIMMK